MLLFPLVALVFAPTLSVAQTVHLIITDPTFFPLTPSLIPSVQTFRWQTADGADDPVDVRHILVRTSMFNNSYQTALFYIQSTPNAPEWSSWMPFASETSWTSPPLDIGGYVFAVQGRDINGVAEQIQVLRNAIYIRNTPHSSGPSLTVTGSSITPITTSTTSTPVTEIGVPGGTSVDFCWTASAAAYGAVVAGYRYGWDILDPDDDAQWEMEFTSLPAQGACSIPRSFQSGQHRIDIEVIDNTDVKSRVPILVNFTPTNAALATWGTVKALYRSP
jgi:hypothetical protein